MQRFRNILVGIDLPPAGQLDDGHLSPPTQEALKRAIDLARSTSARLTLFSAIEFSANAQPLLSRMADNKSPGLDEDVRRMLDRLVQQAGEQGVEAEAKAVYGRGWLELIRQVLREKHDLVVVGTRNRSGWKRLLFGNTALKLLRLCPCPVWVTRPDDRPITESQSSDDEQEVLNILVADDLSEVGLQALRLAVDGGQLFDMKIHLLHAVERSLDEWLVRSGWSQQQLDERHAQSRADAERGLHEHLAQTDFRTLTYGVLPHVVDGPPEAAILQAIEEHDIDLLVMGMMARSGLPGMFIGNTAERLLPELNCSVLAVKPPDFECPVPLE